MSKALRQMMCRGRLFALRCCVLLIMLMGLCAPLLADQAQYIYDDLGRLTKVIDGQGNVATYNYDAVGVKKKVVKKKVSGTVLRREA